jgi:rhomboid protease GluP
VQQEADLRFFHALWTRPVFVTYVLFAANIGIFLLMEFAGGSANLSTLIGFGAKSNYEINQGEIWRFITPIFIHIGLLHLFFNSYALWIIGPQVEKLYGGARFLTIYVLTGVAGVAASYWYHPVGPSAGASGAIFGLFGTLFVFVIKYRNSIPASFRTTLGKGVFVTIGINLVIGFMLPMVDTAAHLGGLVAGGLLAAVIPYELPLRFPTVSFKIAQWILVVLIAGSFFQVFTHYRGPGLSLRNLTQNWGQFGGGGSADVDFADALGAVDTAFRNSSEALSSSDPMNLGNVKKDLATAIDLLKHARSVSSRADEIAHELLTLTEKQYELINDIGREGTVSFENTNRARNNALRYSKLMKDLDAWVEKEGSEYGFIKRK